MARNPLLFEIARDNIINSIKNDVDMQREINALLSSLSKDNVLHEILKDIWGYHEIYFEPDSFHPLKIGVPKINL